MAAYSTLINGDKWFAYGFSRKQNRVNPLHWQAMMTLCKYHGHTTLYPLHDSFGKSKEFPPDIVPYYLGEHSLRLLHRAKSVSKNEDLLLEALIFDCHKVYPPGDMYSPELTERGQNLFDKKHIRYNRKRIKENSILVRKSLGLDIKVNDRLVELNKQCQANELYYLQSKSDKELELMGLPKHSDIFDFTLQKDVSSMSPLTSQKLTEMWWNEFNMLKGWERFDEFGGE